MILDMHLAHTGRDTAEELIRKKEILRNHPLVQAMIDAVPLPMAILNAKRQTVTTNDAMRSWLNTQADLLMGQRPGEILECIRSTCGPDGCGTAPQCFTCGANHAILASQKDAGEVTRECRVTRKRGGREESLDLRVTAALLELAGERFTVCTIEDISERKRLAVLTRIFFHDLLNTAAGIQSGMDLLRRNAARAEHLTPLLAELSQQLIEEIRSQRDLMYAESGELSVQAEPVSTQAMLESLCTLYSGQSVAHDSRIAIRDVWDGRIVTDPRLLARVLGNMLKNALEATHRGGTVSLGCVECGVDVAFTVHNPGFIPEEIQHQIFQRSFSTKGEPGRGIGAYSMKLLGERYLGGRVEFTSHTSEGTTFRFKLPKICN